MEERDYPARPWIGVGVIVWRGDQVLLIRRGKEPRKGQWSIPGGMQELGETARAAGLREVMEETGLAIAIDGLIDVVDLILPDDAGRIRTHYTLIDYYGHSLDESAEPGPGGDVDASRWVSYDSLRDYGLWPQTRRVIDESRVLRQRGTASGKFKTGEQ